MSTFCQKNYGVTFPMMSKVIVKGKDKCEIYDYLTDKSKNGFEDSKVKWNFQKYLLDEDGFLVQVIPPTTPPNDAQIISWLEDKKNRWNFVDKLLFFPLKNLRKRLIIPYFCVCLE